MLSLTRQELQSVVFEGKRYKLSLAFDRVLLFFELLDDDDADDADKLNIGLGLLIKGWRWRKLQEQKQLELLQLIFEKHIKNPKPMNDKKPKTMDYTEDAEYIYSSFFLSYGIDLDKERGRLTWSRFSALLDGLPEQTKLREVVKVRTMEMPKPDKYNGKERAELLELKRYYALRKSIQMGYQEGLASLFNIAKSIAKGG